MSTKQIVLTLLEENRGTPLSGQALSEKMKVSRTSVWKAIQSLREEGHQIDSAPSVGYTLLENSDVLHSTAIKKRLCPPIPNLDITIFSTIDSTNNEAKRILSKGIEQDTLVLSNEQTAGRGRMGRSFLSPADIGLYMSLILKELPEEKDTGLITTLAAVAVSRAIERMTGKRPGIKWVNDLYLDGKKICGILTEGTINMETSSIDSLIVGIGINLRVFEKHLPKELDGIVGGIFTPKEEEVLTRNELAAAVLQEFYSLLSNMQTKEYLEEYRKRCFILGKAVSFRQEGKELEGIAETVDDNGNLIVQLKSGTQKKLSYGEVRLKIPHIGEE